MSERVEQRESQRSDILAMVFYSILVPMLVLLWVYVPAELTASSAAVGEKPPGGEDAPCST